MRLRMELFVEDLDPAIAFYVDVLGFTVRRREPGYASLRRGAVALGLGAVAGLPEHGERPRFSRDRLAVDRGAGVEIVFELDDLDQLTALHTDCQRRGLILDPLQLRPWGLWDFRLADPDGYYLRITTRELPAR